MAFCTTTRWNARRWDTKTIDRIDSAPTAVLDAWGIPIRRRWVGDSRQDAKTIDNGKRFVIDDDTTLRWEHDSKTDQFEGGRFKETIQLDRAPKQARWSTRLELPAGVRFHYQPALTPEEIKEGEERPDWCVGSYAVYDAADCKIGHIPRPYAVTADGKRRWFDLKLACRPHGVDMVVIGDAAWLKGLPKSAFPVLVDPTFGYTSAGGTRANNAGNKVRSGSACTPGTNGDVTSLSMHGQPTGNTIDYTIGVYDDDGDPNNLLRDTGGGQFGSTGTAWYSQPLDSDLAVVSGTTYRFGNNWSGNYFKWSWDAVAGKETAYANAAYATGSLANPFPANGTVAGRDYSIYATYTETGGDIAGSTSVSFFLSGALAGDGALAGSTSVALTLGGAVSGKGALAGSAPIAAAANGSLSAKGSLSGSAGPGFTPSAAIAGKGALTGSAACDLAISGALTAKGTLAGSAAASFSATGLLAGLGAIVGDTSVAFAATGHLAAAGVVAPIAGSASFALSLSGRLRRKIAGPYRTEAGDLFHTGATAGQTFTAGRIAGDVFHTGAAAGQTIA